VIEMTLPWPPSVNSYWRHPTRGALAGRHLISEEGRAYRVSVMEIVLIHRLGKLLTGRLAIQIKASPPDKRRRDLDNILKSLLDSITHADVIVDDSQFDAISILRLPNTSPGKVEIIIHQLENL
jgi:crossover junction endodeoxyribonuclease RusA